MAYRKETTYSCAKNWNVSDSSMNSPRYVRWGESNKIPELRIEPGWTLLVMEGGKKNWYWWRNDTADEEESGGQSATEPVEALPETGMAVNRNCVNREFHRFCPDIIKGMSAQRIDRRAYVGTVSSSSENPSWNCFHANGDCKTFERRTKARLREFSTRNVGSFLKVADLAVISWNASFTWDIIDNRLWANAPWPATIRVYFSSFEGGYLDINPNSYYNQKLRFRFKFSNNFSSIC
ncbi:hypothetical protein R1flu_022693 [Riccia fluitans]|uniref:Uncharacterized protein n=1 Tax=Riccia fluitans TaxID=41844 RepID=A0ABD1XPZ5_9MARC